MQTRLTGCPRVVVGAAVAVIVAAVPTVGLVPWCTTPLRAESLP